MSPLAATAAAAQIMTVKVLMIFTKAFEPELVRLFIVISYEGKLVSPTVHLWTLHNAYCSGVCVLW